MPNPVNRLEIEATVGTDLVGMLEIGFLHPEAPQYKVEVPLTIMNSSLAMPW
ncbi:MAG: hypothetical protein ICV55_14680, partial [Coleofasciculus sp. C3-bin4]|nr:hypothetical protein [Coleofasciculus sp. C3-bin4]